MKNHAKVRLLSDILKLFYQKIRITQHLEILARNVARILLNREKDLMTSLYNNVYLQAYFEYKRLEKI